MYLNKRGLAEWLKVKIYKKQIQRRGVCSDVFDRFWQKILCNIHLGNTGGSESEVYLVHSASKAKTATTRAKDWIRCGLWNCAT